MENISSYDYEQFKTACESFFSAENQLIGPLVWENDNFSLYLRSEVPMNENLPHTNDFGRVGIVYCNYQLMGTNPFKLVVCCKKYEKEDRERNTLYDHEVIRIFKNLSKCIESKAAVVMLEHMKKYWRTSSQNIFDTHSWAVVISNLVSSISEDDEIAKAFKQRYPNLLCMGPVYNMTMRNRRMQARNWLSLQTKHYALVNESFRALGYYTLERMCEINGGFTVEDRPAEKDDKCFEIIEKLIFNIYKDFFMLENKFPERKIIVNTKVVCHGMVRLSPRKIKIINKDGLKIKDELTELYLKKDIFCKDGFYDALSTYIHEMCHMFGGDGSQNFSLALTLAMEKLLLNTKEVEKAREAKPKVVFADAVSDARNAILMRDLAKLIKQNGVDIGEKRLYKWMRENGYICTTDCSPTQRAMDMGLFAIKVSTVNYGGTIPIEKRTTLVTGKGQVYFVNKFLTEKVA